METMAHKPTILIVDDHKPIQITLNGFLANEGYDLIFANNGKEGIEKVVEYNPDLILLDVMMPEMNGFEVCIWLKESRNWNMIPIILVTALDDKKDLARGLDAGADDFVPKPVNSIELKARVRSLLRIKKQHDKLQKQKEDLEKTLDLRKNLADMIVHDMRNPLTSILGFSELMLFKGGITDTKLINGLKNIQKSARRLHQFIDDLLVVAKTEQNKLILNRSYIDMNQFIFQIQDYYTIIAESKKINLLVNVPPQSKQMSFDVALFQRVLDNLLSNALKFSPPSSTVTLQLKYLHQINTGPKIQIKVSDQGPGIAKRDRDRIFNRFEIIPLKQKGVLQTGLGLAFCKMVIEAHGGQIFVTSNESAGATFVIEL